MVGVESNKSGEVCLVILPFSFMMAIVMRRWRTFIIIGWENWKSRTNGMQNFDVLFLD